MEQRGRFDCRSISQTEKIIKTGGSRMSEMGEFWRDMKDVVKQRSQEKRWSNYDFNKKMLHDKGIAFIEKPNGHFIILGCDGKPTHDFWATTGLIIERKTKRRSRGIRNLLRFVQV